jgi:hypothetical protein
VAPDVREELLRGKVAQDITTPIAEMRVSGEVVGKVVEQGTERQEVLAAYVPEFEIRRLTFLLIEAGVSPARVTSVPLALVALHPEERKSEIAGFIHAEPGRCSIAISRGGVLRFARDFVVDLPHRPEAGLPAEASAKAGPELPEYGTIDLGGPKSTASSGPSAGEATAERMVTEITRSLLYFRQLSRGQAVSTLYWSGEPPSRETQELISQRLKLAVSPHPAEAAAPFPAGAKTGPSEFGVPAGLAVAGQVPEQINLLPEGYLRQGKRRRRFFTAAIVTAVFVLAGIVLFFALYNVQGRYERVLDEAVRAAGQRVGVQADFVRWVELKRTADEGSMAEKRLRTPFLRWKALFAAVGKAAPPELSFSVLTLDRDGAGFRGEIRGRVRGKDPAEVQGTLNGFLAVRAQAWGRPSPRSRGCGRCGARRGRGTNRSSSLRSGSRGRADPWRSPALCGKTGRSWLSWRDSPPPCSFHISSSSGRKSARSRASRGTWRPARPRWANPSASGGRWWRRRAGRTGNGKTRSAASTCASPSVPRRTGSWPRSGARR